MCSTTAASQLKVRCSLEWMTSQALTLVFYTCLTHPRELLLVLEGDVHVSLGNIFLSAFSCLLGLLSLFLMLLSWGRVWKACFQYEVKGLIGLCGLRFMWHSPSATFPGFQARCFL